MLKVFTKLLNKLLILKKSQIIFSKPKQNNILIFDEKGSTHPCYNLFLNQKPEKLHVLGEKINLYVLLKLITNLKIPSIKSYIDEYINCVKPKFIFHNSYNIRFFELNKNNFNFSFKKIFTQSELKNHLDFNEFIGNKINLNCDHLLVWSEGMKKKLSKYIDGNYLITGSYLNNNGPVIDKKKFKNKLSFISQFRTFKKINKYDDTKTIREVFHGLKFSWEQFYSADLNVALDLKKFCNENEIEFEVIGTSIDNKDTEKSFFKNKLGDRGWTFVESDKNKRGIYLTTESKYIVTIDSTLGYECLARGQRVNFFSIRSQYLKANYSKFGWVMDLDEEGLCWTTKNNQKDFNRITNFLVNGTDADWENLRNKYLNDLLFYNPKNTIYIKFLKDNLNI